MVVFVHALRAYLVEVDAAFAQQLGGGCAGQAYAFGGEEPVVVPETEFAVEAPMLPGAAASGSREMQ